MSEIEYRGEFYLPNKEKKYSGRIVGDESNSEIILELFGDESLEGTRLTQDLSHDIDYYHPIVLGHSSYPKNMTLLECRWAGTKVIGKNLYQLKYRIQTILRHAIFQSKEKILLNSIRVCIPHVASWYDGWKSHTKIKGVNDESETFQTLPVNNELTINFIDSITKRTIIFGRTQETNYQKYVEFNFSDDQHLEQVIPTIIRFTRLLELSFNKKVNFKLVSAITSNEIIMDSDPQFGNSESTLIYFDNFSYVQRQDVYKDGLHQNNMLFSNWSKGIDKQSLNRIVIEWYDQKKINHIYDMYLDSHNWFEGTDAVLSNVMYNNRCLNLFQGLEDYHRKLINNSKTEENNYNKKREEDFNQNFKSALNLASEDKNLKQFLNNNLKFKKDESTLKERLSWLIKKSKTILLDLFDGENHFNDFPKTAKEYRDKLSHGNLENTFLGDDLDKLFLMAQLLLTICILQSLKIDDSTISQLIKHKTEFRSMIYEIKIKGHNN